MKHGLHKSSTYYSWGNMIQRCSNKNNTNYSYYGGRGIKICKRWLDFTSFLEDMGEKPSAEYSIDCIDPNGDYTPENCRWATKQQQSSNRRLRTFTIDGKTKPIREWLSILNIKRSTYSNRIHMYGWSEYKALTTPVEKRG